MHDKTLFCGIATALVTPFRKEELDVEAFRRLVRWQAESGVHALVVAGTTGEASTLTEYERDCLLEAALTEVGGRLPIIMGTGSNDTATALARTRRAARLGADGALVVTPYYNKGTKTGVRAHFLRIAEEGDLPLILYNVPSRTGVSLSLSDYEVLLPHPQIMGAKEADGDMEKFARLCALSAPKGRVYTGNDGLLLPSLAVGGDGCISVISNILPKNTADIFEFYQKKEQAKALSLYQKMLPLSEALFKETNPSPIKYLAARLGYGDGSLRLPLSPVAKETERQLISAFSPWETR
ncbi:MAG: 4-hydroxy-tetrahydrodipicolinate synthase [Clostridia bacterium]|nr:4-hydroxy-tetrahydrodipicolinate synthase [Clostridia bacterium]